MLKGDDTHTTEIQDTHKTLTKHKKNTTKNNIYQLTLSKTHKIFSKYMYARILSKTNILTPAVQCKLDCHCSLNYHYSKAFRIHSYKNEIVYIHCFKPRQCFK